MAFNQLVAALFQKEIQSNKITQQRFPLSAAGSATAGVLIAAGATPAFSAWTQLVAAAVIPNPAWFTGAYLDVAVNAGANETWVADLGTGATAATTTSLTGAGVASATSMSGYFMWVESWISSVGAAMMQSFAPLTYPIFVSGAPRVSGALAGLVTGGKNGTLSFAAAGNVGV